MFLPDINFWLALSFEAHKHHSAAEGWLESVGESPISFCRLTQLGFLRLATNPTALGSEAKSLNQAWVGYDKLRNDYGVGFLHEPTEIEEILRRLTNLQTFSPKFWNDAYLAAIAEATGLEIVTFDRAFKQFQTIRCTLLT